jgi:hypothetical protein
LEVYYSAGHADVMGAHASGVPAWSISVRPVPSAHRSIAKRSLVEVGLPRVRQWLSEPRRATWLSERHLLQLSIRLPEATIELEEA